MSVHRVELGMLWQSYRAALSRNEYETAAYRLHAYLQQCVTKEDMVPTALPASMIHAQEYKLYGIDVLSKAFDEYPSHGWLLSQQPVDMLSSLKQYHMSSVIEQLKANNGDPKVCNRAIVLIQYLCGLVSSVSNYIAMVSNGVTTSVLNLAKCCLQRVVSHDATECSDLLTIISYCIIYLHLFYDPNRKWKSQFVQNLSNQPTTNVKVSPLDSSLLDFFIRLFDSMGGGAEGEVSEGMTKIQFELLHMFGAVMAASKKNARMILNGKTSALLFTLFRNAPTTSGTSLANVRAIGTRVVVRAVLIAHNWRSQLAELEQPITVDVHVLLYGILHSLNPCKNKDGIKTPLSSTDIIQVCLLLDTIPMITDHRSYSRHRLQDQLISSKCFTSIMSSMATITNTSSKRNNEEDKVFEQLCCSCLRAVTAILRNNKNAKNVFASVVGYKQLAKAIQKLCPINQTILQEFLSMSFDGCVTEQMVYNADALAALHDCFYCLPLSDQLWLLDRLLDVVRKYVHNQQKCCQAGLIRHLLSLLAQHHNGEQQLTNESTVKLVELLEVLASHSISSVELKTFLRLLSPDKDQQLPGYAHMMQRTLLNMALKDTRNLPLHSIDLTATESEIRMEKTLNMKIVGTGFTFHAWIYLAPPVSLETPGALRKRMLYYFGAPNGAGFQAFFRNSGILVIATVTKKREFINLCLQDCPLTHSAWHSVCIVHTLTHRLWSHSEVSVFIDGLFVRTEKMKGPELQEYPVAYIGCGPPVNGESDEDIRMEELLFNITGDMHDQDDTISEGYSLNLSMAMPVETKSVESAREQYGVEGVLRGFLCSACLFSECLGAPMINSIVDKGPNDFSLFQPRKTNSLYEIASKLMFYYHAKGCSDNKCPDLSPLHIPGSTLDATIQAPVYSSWEVKSVLRSLGGVKLLIPLLENTNLSFAGETDKLGVTLFLQLLYAFLDEDNQNLFLLNNGIAIVGALMEEVPADKLTVEALSGVQSLLELAESSVHKTFVMDIYRHLIFNFYIWSRADYTVQSGLVQFASTIVKDNLSLCSKDYGVQFMLNTIQSFYCTDCKESSCKESSCLENEQQKSIAAALFSNIKLYLQKGIKSEDVKALLAAVLSTESFDIQEEILRLLLHILKTSNHASVLGHLLMSEGTPLLALLHSRSNSVSQTVTNIMLSLYKKYSTDEGKLSTSFKDGTFATAMVQMLRHQDTINSNILLSVLDMCTDKSMENLTDYIVNLELCMALLQLLRIADNQAKTTICQQLISLLQLNPAHAVEIARRPAWEMIFLWLLITDDTPATTPLTFSNHRNNKEINNKEDSFADGFEVVSLPFSRLNSDSEKNTPSDDKERLLNTIVEVIGLIVWEEAIDVIVTDEMYLKHAWCRLFTAIRDFTDKHHTMFSSKILLQKLLQFALQIVHVTCSSDGQNTPNFITIVTTILELFEFYCTSYSSHVPRLNDDICSIQLLECYLNLMRTMGLFAGICVDVTVMHFTLRLLMACLTTDDKQYSAIGASRLEELLQCNSEHLNANDVCYLLHALISILQGVQLTGEVESKHYIVLAIKTLFIHSPSSFDTSMLSQLPDPMSNPNFIDDFMAYISQEEWHKFMASFVIPGSIAFWEGHISPLQTKWHDLVKLCGRKLDERDARRLQLVTHQNNKYQEQVLDVFFAKRETFREQFAGDCSNHYVHKQYIIEQWTEIKHSLTGEHGVWNLDNEVPRQFTLQVDHTENFARMRMRLIPDYTSGKHEDASQMRDEGHVDPTTASCDPIEHSLLREARAIRHNTSITSDTSEFSFFLTDDETLSPSKGKLGEENSTEKIIKTVDCQFITLVDFTSGMLHITTHNLHFIPELFTTGVKEIKISVKDIREIHLRRYHLVRSALELFLVDQTNYFFNFLSKKISTKVYSCITSLHTPNLIYSGIIRPHKLLQASGLTHKWVRHQISNFDYIMQLNTLSGRTYNDLNQYPVFPWVLCDYTSEKIDLDDPKVYRDLSKPLGIINPAFEPIIRERYEEFEDPSGEIEKFHYGTHYSNAAGVMHYLIRLEPFTSQHISLQSGKFDHSDRQFFSIANTWEAISTSMSDVKELIPEFYYLPEFLINVNSFDLGKLQDKSQVDDVVLPKWAKDPYDFIHINRQALESDYVSEHLHEWVDLIWGYKQRGEEAIKACNVFYYCTYEGSVDLTSVTSEKKRKQLESMINNFGQIPTQLFFEPHPQRLSLQEARKNLAGKFSTSGQSALNIFENLKELKAFSIEVNNEPLVSVSSPTVKLETVIASGNPEHVLTITNSGLVNKHDWLPFSLSRNKSFTFTLDHNMHLDRSQWQFVGAPFSSSISITDNLFVSSACNNLLVSAGHWDCSFRVHNLVKGKTIRRISHHTDIVICLALDKPGERLITGSRDTTCAIWQFSSQNHNCEKPLQILYGHNTEIICVDVSVELDTVVSGARDGMCIVHSLRKGEYMHTLQSHHEASSKVTHIAISSSNARIVACYRLLQEKRQRLTWLHLFTINGKLLKTLELQQTVTGLIVADNHFVTSSTEMKLIFGQLHNLKQVSSLKLQSPVYSLSLTYQSTHLLVGLADGKLVIVTSSK